MTIWNAKSKLDTKFTFAEPIIIQITGFDWLLQILQASPIQLS